MKSFTTFFIIFLCLITVGCKKYLEAKPDKKLVIPSSIQDVQALLDNEGIVMGRYPSGAEVSADNYYLLTTNWLTLAEYNRRLYTWEKDQIFNIGSNEWSSLFTVVYLANVALESLDKIHSTELNKSDFDNVKGQAYFTRASLYFQAVNMWTKAYDPVSASTDLGLPLRIDSDFNKPSVRATLEETYSFIISDLENAISFLPEKSVHPFRPNRSAAYGLLSRVYLCTNNYEKSLINAESSLSIYDKIIDFNKLDSIPKVTFGLYNEEVLVVNGMVSPLLTQANLKVDSTLYRSYHFNDLRRSHYFFKNPDNTYAFKGSYMGSASSHFCGVATDEIYLNKAECLIRLGNISEGLKTLNYLLKSRWKAGTFEPFYGADKIESLDIVLKERRKQLVFRGLRWMDIKRLNKEGANISLARNVNGKEYLLPANDLRFALSIPEKVIDLSGMKQNP